MSVCFMLFSVMHTTGFGQSSIPVGVFWSDSTHFVKIHNDRDAEFFAEVGCCLPFDLYGRGEYIVSDSMLTIQTFKPDTPYNSTSEVIEVFQESMDVQVVVKSDGITVKHCMVFIRDIRTNEIKHGETASETGLATLDSLAVDSIQHVELIVASLDHDEFAIPMEQVIGKSIEVDLKPYLISRNEQIQFRIRTTGEQIVLLGPHIPHQDHALRARDRIKIMATRWPWNWQFQQNESDCISVFSRDI